jgi:hypothetical protein
VRIELLYFDGCPSYEALLPALRALLAAEGIEDEIELCRVETPGDAARERFLGSPTVRVGGDDVDPGAGERQDFGLKCRLYRTAVGLKPVPSDESIRKALREAG